MINEKIAGLEHRLRHMPEAEDSTTDMVDALNELAWELRGTDSERSLSLSQEAHQISQRLAYRKGIAYSLLNLGICHRYIADYECALMHLLQAHGLFQTLADRHGQASTLNWIGNVYFRMGIYSSALDYYLQSSTISEELHDLQQTATCLTNIGRVYYGLGDYSNSLNYHFRSLKLREGLGDHIEEAMVSWDISRTYYGMQEYESALAYCLQSLQIRKTLHDTRGCSASFHVLGDIYEKTGDYHRSLLNYLRALHAAQTVDEKWGEAMTSSRVGALYAARLDRPDKALSYLCHALEIARNIKAFEISYETHRLLSELYKASGEIDKALEHFELFYSLKEEVTGRQAEQTLQYLQRGYEIEKAQKEAEIYRLKNVELADALYEVQTLNDNLAQVNQRLEMLNREKNEFLGIVAHDLQNPLTGIAMTASLVRSYIGKMQHSDVQQHMQKIESTIGRMKEIIVNLLDINAIESGTMNIVPESVDMTALVQTVIGDYIARALVKHIIIHYIPASPEYAWVDKPATLQILDNLISNAVKYSPHGKNIWISISSDPRAVYVEVRDEGPGFNQEDMKKMFGKFARLSAKPTGGEHSTGLGLSIVKKLIEAMDGSISCRSQSGHGAIFTVQFPIPGTVL